MGVELVGCKLMLSTGDLNKLLRNKTTWRKKTQISVYLEEKKNIRNQVPRIEIPSGKQPFCRHLSEHSYSFPQAWLYNAGMSFHCFDIGVWGQRVFAPHAPLLWAYTHMHCLHAGWPQVAHILAPERIQFKWECHPSQSLYVHTASMKAQEPGNRHKGKDMTVMFCD